MAVSLEHSPKIEDRHIRMARACLELTVRDLAQLAGVNKATIVRMEAGFPARASSLDAVRGALEEKGARFLVCSDTKVVYVACINALAAANDQASA